MNQAQRILALEAALEAFEGHLPPEYQPAALSLFNYVSSQLTEKYDNVGFGVFLDDQADACMELALYISGQKF